MSVNQASITVTGRLTSKPQLRTSKSGRPVADFDLAVNHRRREAGEWEDAPATFLSVRALGQLAENLALLEKGRPVMIIGDLVTDEWTSERDEKRTKTKIIASAGGVDLTTARVSGAIDASFVSRQD